MIVVLFLAILAGLALPQYTKAMERGKAKNGESSLETIYNAQKRYKLDNQRYYACEQKPCDAKKMYEALNITLNTTHFDYNIMEVDNGQGYEAEAVRKEGVCATKKMTMTQENSDIEKECEVW